MNVFYGHRYWSVSVFTQRGKNGSFGASLQRKRMSAEDFAQSSGTGMILIKERTAFNFEGSIKCFFIESSCSKFCMKGFFGMKCKVCSLIHTSTINCPCLRTLLSMIVAREAKSPHHQDSFVSNFRDVRQASMSSRPRLLLWRFQNFMKFQHPNSLLDIEIYCLLLPEYLHLDRDPPSTHCQSCWTLKSEQLCLILWKALEIVEKKNMALPPTLFAAVPESNDGHYESLFCGCAGAMKWLK